MRQDSSGWSCRTMEDGPTLCSFQGSVYNATVSKIVPPSPNTRAALPVLPVSPIKNTSAMAASRRRSTRGESLAQHVDEHRPSAERSTMRKTPPKQQYEYFRRQLQFANDTMITSDEEDVKGKDTYEQIVRLREMLLMKKQSRKNNNVSCNGTYLPPSRTFYPFDSEHTIEKARHRSETPPTPARRQDTIKELLDINLKTYKEIGVGNDTIGRIEIPRLVGSSSGPSMPTELRRSFSTKTLHSLSSDPRQSSSSVLVKDSDASTRQGRPEVRKLVRGIFNDVYDVDKLPQKGAKKAHQRHLSSSNFQSAMGLDSRAKSQQPRVPVRVNTRSRTQNSASPAKPPPFCSSVNNNDYSQAIRANEQELIKLVNTYFPQWRAFVQNLLTDRNVEHDVAMRFYEEIESRRKAKELDMAVQRSEDQQIYEFNHQDEKIASRLREQLCRGHPSRMRQLRILYQVLKDSC